MKKNRPKRAEELQMPAAGTCEDCQAALFPFVLPNKAICVIPWLLAYKQRTKFAPLLYSSISTTECNQWQNLVQRVQLQKRIQCDIAQTEDIFFLMRKVLWSAKAPPLLPGEQIVLRLKGFFFFWTSTDAENQLVWKPCTKAHLLSHFTYTKFFEEDY